jgi:hypothetical protein
MQCSLTWTVKGGIVQCVNPRRQGTIKTPRISLISRIINIKIREISEIRGVFVYKTIGGGFVANMDRLG